LSAENDKFMICEALDYINSRPK